ncbi:unnamed protein product [Schistocephalus solidus]|uniref:Uncharacterized protein n=1 Tax=Schistocephalus solidus TaxID=70667 RepID=A0A3P7C9K1_SCHSO|nr:unnamed protein product [Schistocephalus solidus]
MMVSTFDPIKFEDILETVDIEQLPGILGATTVDSIFRVDGTSLKKCPYLSQFALLSNPKFTTNIRQVYGPRNEVADALPRPSIAHFQPTAGIDLGHMAAVTSCFQTPTAGPLTDHWQRHHSLLITEIEVHLDRPGRSMSMTISGKLKGIPTTNTVAE